MSHVVATTYRNGFAKGAGQARFPSLWRGLLYAWEPSLGPTGSMIPDWGPIRNRVTSMDGTLATVWPPASDGRHAFFDGSGTILATPVQALSSDTLAISCWATRASWASDGFYPALQWNHGATTGVSFWINLAAFSDWGDGAMMMLGNGHNAGRAPRAFSGNVVSGFAAMSWHHFYGCLGPRNAEVWLDGKNVTSTGTVGAIPAISGAAINLNQAGGFSSNYFRNVTVWTTPRTPSEIRLLATRPGIMFEPRRSTSRKSPAAAGNRRRRVLTGAA